MKLRVFSSPEEVASAAASVVEEALREKPEMVLGLPTGSTPILLYRELVQGHERGGLEFARATTFNLDEYCDLPKNHPGSFRSFMAQHLFDPVRLPAVRTHFPEEGADYDRLIEKAGGIDLQILGIGTNGHIAFNEPGSPAMSLTRRVTLTESTRRANAEHFDSLDEVPREAVTMGIASIRRARRILVLATGARKADVVARALQGPVDASIPASYLQDHADVSWYLDTDAAESSTREENNR